MSVKDGSKVSGLGRRLESRRAPTEPKTRRVLYLFSVIVNNAGWGEGCFAVIPKWREITSDRGCNGLWRTTKGFGDVARRVRDVLNLNISSTGRFKNVDPI